MNDLIETIDFKEKELNLNLAKLEALKSHLRDTCYRFKQLEQSHSQLQQLFDELKKTIQ